LPSLPVHKGRTQHTITMKQKITCEAILLSKLDKKFKDKTKDEMVEYAELKFLVEADDKGTEVLTFRAKNFPSTKAPTFKELMQGSVNYGTLVFEYAFNSFAGTYQPKFVSFE